MSVLRGVLTTGALLWLVAFPICLSTTVSTTAGVTVGAEVVATNGGSYAATISADGSRRAFGWPSSDGAPSPSPGAFVGRDSQGRLWADTQYYSLIEGPDGTLSFKDREGIWRIQSLGRTTLRYSSSATQAADIPVLNGNCEALPPTGWAWARASLSYATNPHYEGLASLRVQTAGEYAALCSAYFPVQTGAEYDVSIAVYDENAIPYSARAVHVRWLTPEGAGRSLILGRIYKSLGKWTIWRFHFRAPLGVVRGRLEIRMEASNLLFYVDDLKVTETTRAPHRPIRVEKWGPYVQGDCAWFGFTRTYADVIASQTFRIDSTSPLVDWQVEVTYYQPVQVYEEGVGLSVPVPAGLVLARDLGLVPIAANLTYCSEQHTTHASFFPGGPAFPGFDSFDAMKVSDAGGQCQIDFYLDYWENHPFFLRILSSGEYQDRCPGLRKAGESRQAWVQFAVSPPYLPVVFSRQPFGYEAALGLTEHPDGGTYPGNFAIAYGTEDRLDPNFGKGGILGHGLVWTKAVWKRAQGDAVTMETPGGATLYHELAAAGVEICPHTPTDYNETTAELIANLQDFTAFGSRNFIYHNTNLESLHIAGSDPDSPYYALAALGAAGYRYAYWRDVNCFPDALNMLFPAQTAWVTPLFWHHDQVEDPGFPGVPIFWPTINLQHQPETWLRPANIDRLVAERGVSFTHSYFGAPEEENHAWCRVDGKAQTCPAFEQALSYIAQSAREGRLWVSTVSRIGDFLTGLRQVHVSLGKDGAIILRNDGQGRLLGLTIAFSLPLASARLDGATILSVAQYRLILPVVEPGIHILEVGYGPIPYPGDLEAGFPTVACSWDDAKRLGIVAADGQGVQQISLRIPSLASTTAVWTNVSQRSSQAISFDGEGVAVVTVDFGPVRNTQEFQFTPEPTAQPPQVEIIEPQNEAVIKGNVTVRAAVMPEAAGTAEFFVDGALLGQDGTRPFEWQWNTAAVSVAEGYHTLSVVFGSAYGQAQKSIGVTVDNVTFADVPKTAENWPYVEALARAGITSGCRPAPPLYCPSANVSRAQMAVFLCCAAGKGPLNRETPTFCDVPKDNPYYGWIERLADADSWNGNPPTTGCSSLGCRKFCPWNPVLRDELAVFLVRATGRSPMTSCSGIFADVGPGFWACAYIELLANAASWPGGAAVTSGCAAGPARLYCPKSPVTRGQMAVLIVRAFGIPL